ncbi:MAG: HYR domain-containing protein, partial [Bacteroidota bacterium]|nr:HYR domain-containing protein [Bacteroidota bacterium]
TILSVTHGVICGSGTATLQATASAGTISWYSASTGGTLLGTGTSYIITPSISSTTSYWVESTDAGCSTLTRSEVIATVYALPTITLGTNPSVCIATSSANLTYSATTGGANQYSLSFDAPAITAGFSNVAFSTLTASPIAIIVPGVAPAGTYNANLTVKNSSTGCISINYPITVTINANTAITGQPFAPSTVCESAGVATISVTATGIDLTYQWYVDGTTALTEAAPYSNVTSSTLTITNPAFSLNGKQYTVKVTGTCGPLVTSNAVGLTVDPTSVGGSVGGSATVCTGTNSTTLTLSGYTGTITKWQSSTDNWVTPVDIANTTVTQTATNITATTKYRAVVTSGSCTSANSAEATVTVDPASTGGTASAALSQVCYNSSTILSLVGSTGTIQWEQSADGSTGWAPVTGGSGGTTASYTTPNLIVNTWYRAQVSSGLCSSAVSNTVAVTIDSVLPVFSGCPANMTVNVDPGLCTKVVDWLIPTATDNCGTPTVNVVANEAITTPSPGTHRATIAVGTSTITYTATDSNNNQQTCSFTITVSDNIAPTINCPVGSTVFCAANAPVYASYTEFTNAGGTAGDNCSLATGTFTQLPDNLNGSILTRTYQISDVAGNSTTCTQVFTISQPSVTISSLGFNNTCPGGALTIDATVSGTVHYQWELSTNSGSSWSVIGTDNATFTGTLANLGDQYRVQVSETIDFTQASCNSVSNVLTFIDVTKPVYTGFAPADQIVCTVNGATSIAVSGIRIDDVDVLDNCTAFASLTISYSMTGATAGAGTNLTEGSLFNVGVTNVVYTVTDLSGNSETHPFSITVNQSPDPITISHSIVSGGGTGILPNQCGVYNYSVDGGTPVGGFNYDWKVFAGSGTGGTQVVSGFILAPLNAATVQITWTGDLAPGTYTIEATKTDASSSCVTKGTLVISLQNSFDLQVANPGHNCKGEVAPSTTVIISWTVNELCGTSTWGFTYYLFAQDINTLPVDYLTVNDGAGSFSGIAAATKVFDTNAVNGYPYTQTVYTLFIVNASDMNSTNDYHKFYLTALPNTSEISHP